MQRAPWPVGLVLGVSLALLITLVGPLLLFNPWFTSLLQERHAVAALFATSQAGVAWGIRGWATLFLRAS